MIRSTLWCVAALAIAAPALAHHGPGTFELAKTVSFTSARLTKIEMLNPHGWLYFETTEPDGKVMKHRCEMRSAHVLRRSGWDPAMFKSGEKVAIEASPDRAAVAQQPPRGFQMRPQAVDLLTDVGAGSDQHGLLVQAVRVEAGPAVEKLRDLGFEPRPDGLGLPGRCAFGLVDQPLDLVAILGPVEIGRQAELVSIDAEVVGASALAVERRSPGPRLVSRSRSLHFDHIRTKIAKQHGAKRSGENASEIENFQSFQHQC